MCHIHSTDEPFRLLPATELRGKEYGMYAVKNRFYKHSKLDEQRFRMILELFSRDITAVECARQTGVNVRSVNSIYLKLRDRIGQWCEANASGTPGLHASRAKTLPADQADEQAGNGETADGNVSAYLDSANDGVIGVYLYLMEDQVYCALMNGSGLGEPVIEEGQWCEYPVGIDVRRDMRLKIKNSTYQSAHVAGDIERIESFGHFLRLRLTKFKGLRRAKFYFHLKESEYRYNNRGQDLNNLLLGMLGETPIE